MATSKLFYTFLQLAIGAREDFPFVLDENEWQRLYLFCQRQALLGVGFAAVERLHKLGIVCPTSLRMRWLGVAMQIERRNALLNEQCKRLSERYRRDGLRCCILKGQGNLPNYPEHLRKRRQSGDIDVWAVAASGGKQAIMEYVRQQQSMAGNYGKAHIRYHHIDGPALDGTPVEVHFRVGHFASPLRNRRMQQLFGSHAEECMDNLTPMGFAVPTASVNVVYQLTHLFTHYMDEGLGLRQLLDYHYALRLWHNDSMEKRDLKSRGMWVEGIGAPVMSRDEVMRTLRSFGMKKFAAAVMWVLQTVFAMPDGWLLCRPDEKRGKELLGEIMLAGNFGQYDERGKDMRNGGMIKHGLWKLKRVMRLMRNYPEEALCEPLFRVWHLGWRMVNG